MIEVRDYVLINNDSGRILKKTLYSFSRAFNVKFEVKSNFIGYKSPKKDNCYLFFFSINNNEIIFSYRKDLQSVEKYRVIYNMDKALKVLDIMSSLVLGKNFEIIDDNISNWFNQNLNEKEESVQQSKEYINILNDHFINCNFENIKLNITESEYENYADFAIELGIVIYELLKEKCKPRDFEIIISRLGFTDDKSTLESIGKKHNITRERVRQIVLKTERRTRIYIRKKIIKIINKIPKEEIENYLIYGLYATYNANFVSFLIKTLFVNINFYKQYLNKIENAKNKVYHHLKKEFKNLITKNELENKLLSCINHPIKRCDNPNIFYNFVKERSAFEFNNKGTIKLENSYKPLEYESFSEKQILSKFESIPYIKEVKSQSIKIPYYTKDGHKYYYYPDFQILTEENEIIIIEAKPLLNMLDYKVLKKYEILKKYCTQNGYGYAMIDERFNSFESISNCEIEKDKENEFINFIKKNKKVYYKKYRDYKNENNLNNKEIYKILYNNKEKLKFSRFPFYIGYIY